MTLEKLTIVIPSYNRQQHIQRQMRFWKDYPVTVHILDGSEQPLQTQTTDNVHYHHHPCLFEERLQKAIPLINTPYAMLLSDDEYFIPSALEHCIQYLEEHDDFVACIGQCIGFHSSKTGYHGRSMYDSWKDTGCFEEDPGCRIQKKMEQNDSPVYYSVQRTEAWKNSIELMTRHHFSSPWVQEYQFEIATVYQGKSIVLNELMWLRNTETGPVDYKEWDRTLEFEDWVINYNDEVDKMYTIMAHLIPRDDVRASMDAYLERIRRRKMITTPARIRNKIMRYCPKELRRMLNVARVTWTWKPIMEAAEQMRRDGMVVNMEQLQKIVKFMK